MGIRITNLNVSYDSVTGNIIGYNANIESTDSNFVNASFTLSPSEIDLAPILEVCKQKLQEAVAEN